MEHFEKLALDAALWFQYLDDIFLVWPYGSEQLQNFLNHLNT
jgi:hypothetical protein